MITSKKLTYRVTQGSIFAAWTTLTCGALQWTRNNVYTNLETNNPKLSVDGRVHFSWLSLPGGMNRKLSPS